MRGLHILNLGAGVQSTALYLMFMRGELTPMIDCAIFADTQNEMRATYFHLIWLMSRGGPTILVRSKGSLSDDLLREDDGDRRFATIPAFTEGGGKAARQCSKEYKTEVIERCIRRDLLGLKPGQRVPPDVLVHQYFGISLDEQGRASRIIDRFRRPIDEDNLEFAPEDDYRWAVPHFPLIERFITRQDCERYNRKHVPHEVPQSACKQCPYRDDIRWNKMRSESPEEFAEAVAFDHAIREPGRMASRGMNEKLFLHRSRKPLDLVQFDLNPRAKELQTSLGFYQECEGVCGV